MSIGIDIIMKKLVFYNIASAYDFLGCTSDEIEALMQAQNVSRLPKYYLEFLTRMGKKAGNFWMGSHFFYPDLCDLKESAFELLAEDKKGFVLPDDAFINMMHQGYQFAYFHTETDDEDPPVFFYLENAGEAKRIANSVTEFLDGSAEDFKKFYKK
jgi:hypothetical protein